MEELGKLCKKGAICEIQEYLGEISVANERIKEIKAALKEDYDAAEADRIVALAKLLEADTYNKNIDKMNAIEELYEEIRG